MEFLRERVYTALNADELRARDKVIVADTLDGLKHKVQKGKDILVLQGINPETWGRRFSLTNTDYALAYLVERKENCTNCEKFKTGYCIDGWDVDAQKIFRCEDYTPKTEKRCTKCRMATKLSDGTLACDVDGYPVDCTPPHDEACSDYKPKTEQKAEKKCGNCGKCGTECEGNNIYTKACPEWTSMVKKHYRPFKDTDELIKVWCDKGGKWQKRELTMPHIWVRCKASGNSYLITGYFTNDNEVCFSASGFSMNDLLKDYEFLDGSVCGVEE